MNKRQIIQILFHTVLLEIARAFEVSGLTTNGDRNKTKRSYLAAWVKVVNEQGCFGEWASAVSFHPGDLECQICKY
jgi:hypothetical protein